MKINTPLLLFLCFFLLPLRLGALELGLATLNSYTDSVSITLTDDEKHVTDLLYNKLIAADTYRYLTFSRYSQVVRSILEASDLTKQVRQELILYGYLQKENGRLLLEVRLYDHTARENKKIFYTIAVHQEFDEMLNEMSRKIISYIYKTMNIGDMQSVRLNDGLNLSINGGYNLPITYNDRLFGIAAIGLDLRVKFKDVGTLGRFPYLYPYLVGHVGYAYAANQPHYFNTMYHQFTLSAGVGLGIELPAHHLFLLETGPLGEITYTIASQFHAADKSFLGKAAGLMVGLGYQYWLPNRRLGFGIHNRFEFLFYDKVYISYKPTFSLSIQLGKIEQNSGQASSLSESPQKPAVTDPPRLTAPAPEAPAITNRNEEIKDDKPNLLPESVSEIPDAKDDSEVSDEI